MKRVALTIALALTVMCFAVAQSNDDPSQVCDAAKVGLYLPDDTQATIDTGTWIAYSASEALTVMLDKYDTVFAAKDLSEKNVAKAAAKNGVKDFVFVDTHSDNGLDFAYGKGTYKDGKGVAHDGFFGLLVNSDVKKKTFFFAFMVPSLKSKTLYDAILDMVDTMVPME